MNIGLFRKTYTVKRYEPQKLVKGYTSSSYSFLKMNLNVQPFSPDELIALPEGERELKYIKAFGSSMLTAVNDYVGTLGDRLFYQGYWYECKSSVYWDHTMLTHYRSEFVLCKEQEEPPPVKEDDTG